MNTPQGDVVRRQVDRMGVGAVSLVQNGAVPDSNGFLVVQMADDSEVSIDLSDMNSICEEFVGVIQSAPEIAIRMAAIDQLAVALRTAVSPEGSPVLQSADVASKISGWDTWQGWQEYVTENVHTDAEALQAIDELAALQKSEITQESPQGEEENVTKPTTPKVEQDPAVTQALAALDQSEKAIQQARVALGKSNKLAEGDSPNLREEDTRPLSEMTVSDDTDPEDAGDEDEDASLEGAEADGDESLEGAMNGDDDLALSTRDRAEGVQNIKRTNTVVPPAATEAAHPRTFPTIKDQVPNQEAVKGPGKNAVDAHMVNQSEEIDEETIMQEASQLLAELSGQTVSSETVVQADALWGQLGDTLNETVMQGHAHALDPVPHQEDTVTQAALPKEVAVLQATLEKAVARIAELESPPPRRPRSRQSDADAAPVVQGAKSGLWDSITPSV